MCTWVVFVVLWNKVRSLAVFLSLSDSTKVKGGKKYTKKKKKCFKLIMILNNNKIKYININHHIINYKNKCFKIKYIYNISNIFCLCFQVKNVETSSFQSSYYQLQKEMF